MPKVIMGIIVGLICVGMIVCFLFYNKKEEKTEPTKTTPIMELEEYKNIKLENIEKINIRRYTEGGLEETVKETKEEIEETYQFVSGYKVGKETNYACEDNTTIYEFVLKDNQTIAIEKECDWIIIGKKRFEVSR